MTTRPGLSLLALTMLGTSAWEASCRGQSVVTESTYHLGTPGQPEWQEFADKTPHGRHLEIHFTGQANPHEATLLIRQSDVKHRWQVRLNDRDLGALVPMETALMHAWPVPPDTLHNGRNTLTITPPEALDDILVGPILLDPRPPHEALHQATLEVRVRDLDRGEALPCRITIVDERGDLAPLWVHPEPRLAVRTGVIYTADGQVRMGLRPGRYTLYATRGFEYGLDSQTVTLKAGQSRAIALQIRHEVPTPGLVACDTHIHTLTHSGHGDATLEERLVTIVGEGIELPIATDHNHHTDYDEPARRLGLRGRFTPVIGNEVTTRTGHFNAFPFAPQDPIPDAGLEDWPRLMRSIREATGRPVVILNHPRDIHSDFRPFDPRHFDPVTGEHARGPNLDFDALEVVNSGALQSDLMQLFRDWFALLNHGHRLTAVGGSDSHDVTRFIVGQGRTYIACDDEDPGNLDIARACRQLRDGRALVSLGLLTHLTVEDRFQAGDLATDLGEQVRVTVTVLGPSWTTADRIELYANGVLVRAQAIEAPPRAIEKTRLHWTLPRPSHDVYLVAIASGPGVTAPYWPIPRPYQPSSREWEPRVLGATNPVWLDADGDGQFTSARAYAAAVIDGVGTAPAALLPALAGYDEAVAAQAAALCQAAGQDVRSPAFRRHLEEAAAPVQRGFAAVAATRPTVEPVGP